MVFIVVRWSVIVSRLFFTSFRSKFLIALTCGHLVLSSRRFSPSARKSNDNDRTDMVIRYILVLQRAVRVNECVNLAVIVRNGVSCAVLSRATSGCYLVRGWSMVEMVEMKNIYLDDA